MGVERHIWAWRGTYERREACTRICVSSLAYVCAGEGIGQPEAATSVCEGSSRESQRSLQA